TKRPAQVRHRTSSCLLLDLTLLPDQTGASTPTVQQLPEVHIRRRPCHWPTPLAELSHAVRTEEPTGGLPPPRPGAKVTEALVSPTRNKGHLKLRSSRRRFDLWLMT